MSDKFEKLINFYAKRREAERNKALSKSKIEAGQKNIKKEKSSSRNTLYEKDNSIIEAAKTVKSFNRINTSSIFYPVVRKASNEIIKNEKIKNIKNNNYPINSNELRKQLRTLSKTKDMELNSIFFGFYFLDSNIQNQYLTKDEDTEKSRRKDTRIKTESDKLKQRGELRMDKINIEGYNKLINSKEYKKMIEDLDRLTYSSSFNYLAKNGFKNLNNIEIENKILNPNFSDGLLKNFFDILTNPGGLPITLRTSTLYSKSLIKTEIKNDGIHLKITKRYKLYDEFKKPYNIKNGLPYSKETGTPYSMSDGYKNKVLIDKTFKNEKEALKFLKEMTIKKEAVKTR